MRHVVLLTSRARSLRSWWFLLVSILAAPVLALPSGAVSDDNIVWPRALQIPLSPVAGVLEGTVGGTFSYNDESRWFKFRVQPQSRVVVTLDALTVDADLVLFKDIALAYQTLVSPDDLPLLDAEFADDAFSPAQFSPAQFSPAQFSPAAFSPAQFSPAQFSPAQFSPAQFSEEAYASAQTRSVIAVSAFNGTLAEGVVANTWNEDSEFYIRVRMRNGIALSRSFRVNVYLFPGVCSDLTSIPVDGSGQPLPPSATRAPAGSYRTLILTDLNRMFGPGSSPERDALTAQLSQLASRPEVQGAVVDVAADPWVAFFNQQADLNPQCPYGKNLVAEAIRALVDRSRPGNALEYLVLVGGDGVIPFFRLPDEAMLGPELGFVPPVFEFSASQASLRHNYFLSQDRYGARCEISRKLSRIAIPELAVGRLVETPSEIATVIEAYLENPGGVRPAPTSALVTGYDFLQDAAEAIASEIQAGAGIVPDRLITPSDLAPADPDSWTATDLENAILGKRHDILFLAGHFSAGATLAADYKTAMPAFRLFDAPTGFFRNALLYSAGCHSGYNIVDGDAIQGVTIQPDWAQVSARLGMTLIAGTGYQYGDTDFIEYSERLYLYFTRQLRTGSGPVSVGKALVRAKIEYLESTADLRGIHEKALYQASLFGLPMFAMDLPGARIQPPSAASNVASASTYAGAPGSVLGLRFADVTVQPTLTPHTLTLENVERDPNDPNSPAQVVAKWYSGANGIVAHPAEPVLPLEIRNVQLADFALRGIGFRGGSYSDEPNVTPLTGAATTEIRGVHPAFLSDVLFPPKMWRANYFGILCDPDGGPTRLMVTPAQFQSYPVSNSGVLRTFSRLDFRLFYSANIETYSVDQNNDGTPESSATPALSSAPQISSVDARTDGGLIRFRVVVVGNPAAGIQETWVTYTSLSGPRRGNWTSLNLTQNAADSRLWEGSIPIGSSPANDVRFLVQSVNGVGLVAFSANLGAYFAPDQNLAPTTPPAASRVEFLSPPSGGLYGQRIQVQARLTSGGSPLAQRVLIFQLGRLQAQSLTGADGIAQINLNLLHEPSTTPLPLNAQWQGSATLAPASARSSFLLAKSPTILTLAPSPATVHPNASETVIATLTDSSGGILAEQSVIFVVEGSGGTRVAASITDFNGRAALGSVDLPPGSYTVTAYFGQTVQPPAPFPSLGSPNPLYEASDDSTTLILDPAVPTAVDDEVVGKPGKPLKIAAASLVGNDSDPNGGTLQISAVQNPTGRAVSVTQSGGWIFLGALPNGVRSDAFDYTISNPSGKTARARVVIHIEPDEAPTSNILDVTPVGSNVRLRFAGIPGRIYRIQFTPGVSPPAWQTLGQARIGIDGIGTFLAPAPVGDAGFFRTAYP